MTVQIILTNNDAVQAKASVDEVSEIVTFAAAEWRLAKVEDSKGRTHWINPEPSLRSVMRRRPA